MPTVTSDAPQAVKDLLAEFARRELYDTRQHIELFKWKNNSYSCWILNLESLRPVNEYFGNRHDSFTFCNGEHFEELRQAVMLEF